MRAAYVVAIVCGILTGCKGVTSVRDLLNDPGRYDGQTVRIVGDVQNAVGALGIGAYQLNDGTGTINVISKGGGAPRQGARVGVEGTFRSAFTFGTQSGAVLVEERRYTP